MSRVTKGKTRNFSHPTNCPECGKHAYHAGWGCEACGLGNPFRSIACLTPLASKVLPDGRLALSKAERGEP